MWSYEKRLQYPVNITTPNAKLAEVIISQYGGPDGEMGASMRYLSQRYGVPYPEIAAVLTDIGTEAAEMFRSGADAFFDAFAVFKPRELKHVCVSAPDSGDWGLCVDWTDYDDCLGKLFLAVCKAHSQGNQGYAISV